MIRRSTLIAVEIVLGLVAALAIGLGIAWWRLSQGPLELGFFREQMQAELSAARGGRPVGIDRVELGLSRSSSALELRAIGVSVQDSAGAVLSRAEEARIELNVLPLLIGRVSLVRAEFDGGEITLTNRPNGALHVAFGPPGTPPDIIIAPPPPDETLAQRVARVLDGLEATFRPVGAGGALRAISLRGAKLAIIDERGGGRWSADAANLELSRRDATLALSADARLEGADGLAPATLRITTDTSFQTAVIEFGARDVRPRALLSPAALGPFAALDAPLTATLSIGLDRQAGIKRFEGEVVIGRGIAAMPGGRFDVSGGRLRGRYDFDSDELIFDQMQLAGSRTRIDGEVRVRNFSAIMRAAPDQPAAFDIALPSMTLDVPGTFAAPLSFSDVVAVGAIASGQRSIALTRFSARTGEAVVRAEGRLYWAEAGAEGKLTPGVELRGAVEGALGARDVLRMWPINVGDAARSYLDRAMVAGAVTNGTFNLDIRPADFLAAALRNEAVDVRFDVSDAAFRYVQTMVPVTAGRGSAVLRGNRFDMVVPQARLNGLALSNGRVELPRLNPKGAMATISARVDGEARNLLEVLAQEPINLDERLPVEIASATGRAGLTLRLQRPMLREAPIELWRFSIDGAVRDFAGTMSEGGVALSQGQFAVRGDQRAIVVSGPIRAGRSDIPEVRWTERINAGARVSSDYAIAGVFDANDLARLGFPIARYAQGRIGVRVSGDGRGFNVNRARVDLDLTDAAIQAPRQFWTKRAGIAASMRFVAERQRDGGLALNAIDGRGGGLFVQGRVRLARDERLLEADLPRLAVEGRSDARIGATRGGDGGLDVAVRGALFDAAPFMTGDDAPDEAGPRTAAVAAPVRASIEVDRLKMRGGATMSDARVSFASARGVLTTLSAQGVSPDGRPFSLALGPRPGEPAGRIVFRSDDAGFAVRALTGSENVVGGAASADGEWRGGRARFTINMRNFQVVRLPALAQLLSSAGSLRGLVGALNGDGIAFSQMEAQMTYANDRVAFTEGSMRGPSLGLTASGAYDMKRDNLDINGVVAPSPLLNLSMLGEIPVLGNLLVSRRGEGVVGMTYSINGRVAQPRVGVNPLSALTPGIFRRIFEPAPAREPAPSSGGAETQADDEARTQAQAQQPALQ
jgi:Protein of unknown function/AsmA-like C-terminal region